MNRNIYFTLLFVLPILAFVACGHGNQQSTTGSSADKSFEQIVIPDTLVSPEDRSAYLVTRYWDNFDFSDTTYIHTPEITEQAFVGYLSVFPYTEKEIINASIAAMLTRTIAEDATGKMYPYFLNLYREYLYDPHSPVRNDEFYIPVTEYIIGNPVNDFSTKEHAKFDLSMMLKNRLGTVASDFSYITAAGIKGKLHKLNKDYTIIYFYNPDCTACEEATNFMRNSSILNHLAKSGRLDILALYVDDEIDLWTRHRNQIPPLWIDARDEPHIIRNSVLYELKATPSIYLLNKNKTVLLKDVDAMTIEAYFK